MWYFTWILGVLLAAVSYLAPAESKLPVLLAGVWGIVTYVGVNVLGGLLAGDGEDGDGMKAIMRGGIGGFVYLEVLDAERNLFDGQLALTEARRSRILAAVKTYRALGGGWDIH